MITMPSAPEHGRTRRQQVGFAVRHPATWMRELTGGGPVYALLVLFGIALAEVLDRSSFAVLLPDVRDAFGLTDTGILTINALTALFAICMTVPISLLSDRGNRVRLMIAGAFVFTLFSGLTGLIPVIWWVLLFVRLGSGVGQATVFPTHNSLMSDYFDIGYRPRVFSFHRGAEAVGMFIGPILAGQLAQAFGWRVPFLVLALPGALFLLLAFRMKEPVRGRWERQAMGASAEVAAIEEAPPSFEEAWRMVWKIDSLRRIFYALPFLAVSFVGFAQLANLLYADEFGLDAAQRGWIEALAEPAQILGLFFAGVIGTRLMRRGDPALVIRFVTVVAVIASAFAAVFALSPWIWLGVLARMGIAASLAAVLPAVFASLSLGIPARARSAGFSVAALFFIPGLIMLPLIGWINTHIGIRAGMLLLTPLFVVGGVIISSAHKLIDGDIRNVWTATAARSELLYERRQGRIKQVLVRSLDVRYGDVQILFNVDFEVDQGEIVALLGTNGAGKSTLLKAICGVVEADNGTVIFDGRDITHAPPHEIAAHGIAMMPGGQGVFPSLTVHENLRMAGWLERRKPQEVAGRIDEVIARFPVLGERLDEPAANLSGGQQQMLALGMALLARPKLLMIDELSLGLAPVIVEQLVPVVRAIRDQGTTVILVEQSVNVALTMAETAYFMEKGEIRFHGPTAELLQRPDVLRSVFLEGASKGLGPSGRPASGEVVASGAGHLSGNGTGAGARAAGPEPMMASAPPPEPGDVATPAALRAVDLSVRFGGIRAVDDVSLELAPGEIVGVIGPNGAGKTTLFDLLSGFTSADGGRVWLDGVDISRASAAARARLGVGRSFQDARLFPALTVEETIAVALERWIDVRDPFNAALRLPVAQDAEVAVRWRVDQLIELLGLEAFRSKFVRELSTGSRRVVDLACVVAHHPRVVLLDEPSSGIAQREAEALGPLLVRIRDTLGASVLVIEHDMPLITSVSSRLIALDQGHVVTSGPPEVVLSHPEVVASYLGSDASTIGRSGARPPSGDPT